MNDGRSTEELTSSPDRDTTPTPRVTTEPHPTERSPLERPAFTEGEGTLPDTATTSADPPIFDGRMLGNPTEVAAAVSTQLNAAGQAEGPMEPADEGKLAGAVKEAVPNATPAQLQLASGLEQMREKNSLNDVERVNLAKQLNDVGFTRKEGSLFLESTNLFEEEKKKLLEMLPEEIEREKLPEQEQAQSQQQIEALEQQANIALETEAQKVEAMEESEEKKDRIGFLERNRTKIKQATEYLKDGSIFTLKVGSIIAAALYILIIIEMSAINKGSGRGKR